MDTAAGIAFAVDGATAAAGAFNAVVLLTRHASTGTAARRTAVIALAALNAGVALQAVFAQALYAAQRSDADTAPFFDAGPWLASRALLLAGTLLMAMLLTRRTAR